MARRNSYPGDKWNTRPGQAYSRTSGWPTRYYQRKIGGTMISALAGLNVTSDDFAKREGESPYMWNARLSGTKEKRKRAQSMSRMGQEFFIMPEGAETTVTAPASDLKIMINEKTSIRWNVFVEDKLTQVGLRFLFDKKPATNAHFVLILRDSELNEVCRSIASVEDLYDHVGIKWFRFIRTATGNVTLEATLVDDVDNSGKPINLNMYIESNGTSNHSYSYHDLPNLDSALREEKYEWHRGVSIPNTSIKHTSWKSFPVWLQRGYFNSDGSRWAVMGAINGSNQKVVYAVKYADFVAETGEITTDGVKAIKLLIPAGKIDQNTKKIRMTQAGDELYFVDGYSALQRVKLSDSTWPITNAVPSLAEVDTFGYAGGMYYYVNSIIIANKGQGNKFFRCIEDHQGGDTFTSSAGDKHEYDYWTEVDDGASLTAWPGASLIYFHNNRLLLSGFRNDTVGEGGSAKAEPNLVIMSSVTSVRPQYDMFNKSIEFFYVPDRSQSQSAASPVTAFSHIGDYLAVFTTDGLYLEQIQSAVEFAGIAQTTPEGSQYGVMCQEHVAEGRNNIYFYNPTMGIMRTAGSTATVMSSPIDAILARISDEAKASAHLCMTDELLRFYYSEDGGPNKESFVDYATIPAHKSYWFRDNNTPVCSTYIDTPADMYLAEHSEYPCMMLIDNTYKDFDCAILYEYYTKYIGTPDRLDHVIVRRVHVTTLQTFQSSIYIGLDYNHNNKPIVWRKFITPVDKGTFNPEDVFGDDEESGATNIDIRILTDDTRFVQIRLKQYCYDFQAEIMQVGFEYANRTTL